MSLSLHARRLFDGRSWHDGAAVAVEAEHIVAVERRARRGGDSEVAVLMPGLVDFGVVATGYSEGPSELPFAPERAFSLLCLLHGVTTVVDVGSSPAVARQYRAHDGPDVLFSGGRLSEALGTRNDVLVTEDDAPAVAQGLVSTGASLISAGVVSEATADALEQLARRRDLPLARSADVRDGMRPGWWWSSPIQPPGGARHLCGELAAGERWTIDGLLDAADAPNALGFLPYARHFRASHGRIGRRIGRSVLERMYGDRAELDMEALRSEARSALLERRYLASSSAGRPGLVPGRSLWRELEMLSELAGDEDLALHAATGVAKSVGIGDRGVIQVGARADLLALDRFALGPSGAAKVVGVMVSGRSVDLEALGLELRRLNDLVMRSDV